MDSGTVLCECPRSSPRSLLHTQNLIITKRNPGCSGCEIPTGNQPGSLFPACPRSASLLGPDTCRDGCWWGDPTAEPEGDRGHAVTCLPPPSIVVLDKSESLELGRGVCYRGSICSHLLRKESKCHKAVLELLWLPPAARDGSGLNKPREGPRRRWESFGEGGSHSEKALKSANWH